MGFYHQRREERSETYRAKWHFFMLSCIHFYVTSLSSSTLSKFSVISETYWRVDSYVTLILQLITSVATTRTIYSAIIPNFTNSIRTCNTSWSSNAEEVITLLHWEKFCTKSYIHNKCKSAQKHSNILKCTIITQF